jgi:hypothetical protein
MESIEIIVKSQTYKVIRNPDNAEFFNVFNYATYFIIKKNSFGIWEKVEHRFGADDLPIDEIGDAIDKHYSFLACQAMLKQG